MTTTICRICVRAWATLQKPPSHTCEGHTPGTPTETK